MRLKYPTPTTEVIKLTEECSTTILNKPPKKKEDPGCPTIDCSIGNQYFNNALCDLGASVSVMPASVYKKLENATLEPTSMCLQLADQSVRHPLGIAENILVKIRDFLVPVDFVVLDMSPDSKSVHYPWKANSEHRQCPHRCRERRNQVQHKRKRRTLHIQTQTRERPYSERSS